MQFTNFAWMGFTDKFDKEDFYLTPEGYVVFTERYHLKRGYCCDSHCKHCPYRDKDGRDKPGTRDPVKPD